MQHNYLSDRKRTISELKENGINPFPYRFEISHNIPEIFEVYNENDQYGLSVSIAGRIMLYRKMGKAAFMHIHDFTGKIQIYIKMDIVGKEKYDLLKKISVGDIIGVKGRVFTTKTGETTVLADEYTLLSKALRQLPEKYHGIRDKGQIYRQRCLDMIMNFNTRTIFQKRALIIKHIRDWLYKRGFLEVDVPVIQMAYGGAEAKPFTTFINAIDTEAFLSISPELYLKRYIVGGFEKVFSMQKAFRNEGIDATHNPEFTLLELYQSYIDYNDIMELAENLISSTAYHINGNYEIDTDSGRINVTPPFKRVSLLSLVREKIGRDPYDIDINELREIALRIEHKEKPEKEASRGEIISFIFDALCEKDLIMPTFVIDYPRESSPLCKVHRSDDRLIERFELFINGKEFANAYSELNDPILQREALEAQSRKLRAGCAEAMPMDEYFVRAVEYGMPPAGGIGFGIDRLVMLITGQDNIKDVITFPIVRYEQETDGTETKPEKKDISFTNPGISIERAFQLFDEYIKSETLKIHTLSSANVMKGIAKHFGHDQDYFFITGLLHDLDFDMEQRENKHGLMTLEILRKEGVNPDIINAIKRHNEGLGEPRQNFLDHALASSETVTGLIYAAALILPEKKLKKLKVSSVIKRMKKKDFAKKVNRDTIRESEKLGITLEEFIKIAIDSMLEIADKIGI